MRTKLTLYTLLAFIFFIAKVSGQTYLGTPGFSTQASSNNAIAFDSAGVAYVAYSNESNKMTVTKFNGSEWVEWADISPQNYIWNINIAISASGTPYISYMADVGGSLSGFVMKFNGSNWEAVGQPSYDIDNISLALDSSGTPYAAYADFSHGYKLSVQKFSSSDNSWLHIGGPGFTSGEVWTTRKAIAIDASGTPYVVFRDASNSKKATVKKFNGTAWVNVGSAGFSAGDVSAGTLIALDAAGTPYAAYVDVQNGNKATVKKFNGTAWETVGSEGFTPAVLDDLGILNYRRPNISLAINASGSPYVAYRDTAGKAGIKKFNGTAWETVNIGTEVVTSDIAKNISLAIHANNNYLAFSDNAHQDKVSVLQFCGLTATTSQVNVLCHGAATGSATVNATGGVGTYTYSWTGSSSTTATATGLAAGDYTVTVTDESNCTAAASFTITQPAALTVTSSQTNVTCLGSTDGAISFTASGGTAPYTYNFKAAGSTPSPTYCSSFFDTASYEFIKNVSFAGIHNTSAGDAGFTVDYTSQVANVAAGGTYSIAVTIDPDSNDYVFAYIDWNQNGTLNDPGEVYTIASSVGTAGPHILNISVPETAIRGYTRMRVICQYSSAITNPCINTNGGEAEDYTVNVADTVSDTTLISGLASATYNLTVIDANGCANTSSVTITQPAALDGTTVVTNVACFGSTTGAINLTPSGGTSPYTFDWGGGITTEDRTGLAAGDYSVTIKDANNCTKTKTISITQPAAALGGTTVVTNVACFGSTTGAINLTPTGGTAPYAFSWTGGTTTEDKGSLAAGDYSVTIEDANNCTAVVAATVTQPAAALGGTTVVTNVTCFGTATGTINLTPTGGTAPYTFDWGGGITIEDRTELAAGDYSVTIKDANNCTKIVTATITQSGTTVEASATVTNISCKGNNDGTIHIAPVGGTSPYTFAMEKVPAPNNAVYCNSNFTNFSCRILNVTFSGIYNNSGAGTGPPSNYTSQVAQVTPASTPTMSVAIATGSPFSLGNIFAFIDWNQNGILNDAGEVYEIATNVPTHSYTQTITVPATAVPGNTRMRVICITQNPNINPCGIQSYNGEAEDYTVKVASPVNDVTDTISNLSPGTYKIMITDANGCTKTVTSTITEPATALGGSVVVTPACFGSATGAINLTPTGGTAPYTFDWGGGITTEDRTELTAGDYSVTITDANNCTATVTASITQPAAALGGTTVVTHVACFGSATGAINLTPTGGTAPYTFNWTGGTTTEDKTSLAAGDYSVTIKDSKNCTAVITVTITQPAAALDGSIAVTHPCFGSATGAINLTPSGGTAPYTFDWGGGITTEDRTGLDPGDYSVTIKDANNCTKTITVTVAQPAAALGGTTVVTNVACFGSATGSINLTPTGGTAPYTFNWTGGTTTEDKGSLAAGDYSVTITDANGCTATVTATIAQPAAALNATTIMKPACFDSQTGTINLIPTGGTAPYTFDWGSGITTEDRTGLAAGNYSVTITDANSCTKTITATVTQPASGLTSMVEVTNVACFGSATGAFTMNLAGGTPPYAFNWSDGATTEDRTGLTAGDYTLTVTDANSCTVTGTLTIEQPEAPLAGTVVVSPTCYGIATGSINLTPSGGTAPYTYSWADGTTTKNRIGLVAGEYSVIITDAKGCTAIAMATITQPTTSLGGTTTVTPAVCFGSATGAINLTPSGGTEPYVFDWGDSVTTEDRGNLNAGDYSVIITDANGCTATVTATITQPAVVLGATAAVTHVACFGIPTGAIDLTPSGGTAPYTFNWGNGVISEDVTGLPVGTHDVTITDAKGCTATIGYEVTGPGAALHAGIASASNVLCRGTATGTITAYGMDGTAPYTYLWSNGATTEAINWLPAGVYSVTVTDAKGCTITISYEITEPAEDFFASIALVNDSWCYGSDTGAVQASATGGTSPYTYQWSNGATTAAINGLSPGVYMVTVTDGNGCTATIGHEITEPSDPLEANFTSFGNSDCHGSDTGFIFVEPTHGTGPYTYLWSNGATTAGINGLSPGVYTVTVTDANGCTATASDEITEPDNALSIEITGATNVTCPGVPTGAVTANAIGGTSPYYYSWSNGAITESITGLHPGVYTLTVTDDMGCTATADYEITGPAPLQAVITNVSDVLSVSATGAIYQWGSCDGNGGFNPIDGATAQTYQVTTIGDYAVRITIDGCMQQTDCFGVDVLSVKDSYGLARLRVYPNPSTGVFVIDSEANANVNVQVFDMVGKVLLAKPLTTDNTTIDLNSYADGIYLLHVTVEGGSYKVFKLIKKNR